MHCVAPANASSRLQTCVCNTRHDLPGGECAKPWPAAGLGRALDPGADEDDVAAGTRLELPLWMVHNLAVRGFVSLQCVT
jgi:hypothetical protein